MNRAGFSTAEISANSGHLDLSTMEKFKKWAALQNSRNRHEAAMVTTASGRGMLRGQNNLFGKYDEKTDTMHSKLKTIKEKQVRHFSLIYSPVKYIYNI